MRPGAQYRPHYDYFDPGEPGTPTILRRGGQRVATLVMYLQEPEQGGATTFPDVGLEVAPKRGTGVFFSYDRPDPAHARCMAAHRCSPARNGSRPSGCANESSSDPHFGIRKANGHEDRSRTAFRSR